MDESIRLYISSKVSNFSPIFRNILELVLFKNSFNSGNIEMDCLSDNKSLPLQLP